jgi:aspartokinase-like uncharacterized kinase
MEPASLLVVKVGGSLFDVLPAIVRTLAAGPGRYLLVPGGGRFADMVRDLDVDDDSAHWMAIAAMEIVGHYIVSQGIPGTEHLAIPKHTSILLPYRELRMQDPLPHSWEITSDTIAAWFAAELGADLLLLKSVAGIMRDGRLQPTVTEPFRCAEVDPAFLPYVLTHRIRTSIVNGRDQELLSGVLAGTRDPGTVVYPAL